MRLIFVMFGICFLVEACGEKDTEQVINLKDVIPKAEGAKLVLKRKNTNEPDDRFNMQLAGESGVAIDGFHSVDVTLLPDRFNPTSATKLALTKGKDSVLFSQWIFQDSSQTQNAFYNWLDCFGQTCKSFKIGQQGRFQYESFIMFVNDTSLTYISAQIKLNPKQWVQYFEKNNAIDTWRYVVYQPNRAKASWFDVSKGIVTPLVIH
jgi:hypothetical protein